MAELSRKWCFLQEKHFLVSLFSLSALFFFFFGGGGGIELGNFPKNTYYGGGNTNSPFCLIGRIFLVQTNITAQRAELLLLPVAEIYTLLAGSLMKTISGGKNGNFAEIAAGTLRKIVLCC